MTFRRYHIQNDRQLCTHCCVRGQAVRTTISSNSAGCEQKPFLLRAKIMNITVNCCGLSCQTSVHTHAILITPGGGSMIADISVYSLFTTSSQ